MATVAAKPLNQTERRYWLERLSQTLKERREVINEKYTKTVPSGLTDSKKIRMVKNWEVSLKRGVTVKTPVGEAFYFDDESKEVTDEKGVLKEFRTVRKKYNKARDIVMSESADKALKAARKFCETD